MFRRFRAREVALQLLFQQDQNKSPMARPAAKAFARERLNDDTPGVEFCMGLFDGALAQQPEIDACITRIAENWRLSRMLPADRNVLRLGTYELLFASTPEPVPVLLNEAIELARRYGSKDSPGFVNGVLDRVARERQPTAS